MKAILLAITITGLSLQAAAQLKGFSFGPYVEIGWPTGGLATTNGNGIGAGLDAGIRLGKIGLTGSAGYIRFGGRPIATADGVKHYPSREAIPLRVGIRYRFLHL